MPLNIAAALVVKKIMERDKIPGTLVLWPGVAEELNAGADRLQKLNPALIYCGISGFGPDGPDAGPDAGPQPPSS